MRYQHIKQKSLYTQHLSVQNKDPFVNKLIRGSQRSQAKQSNQLKTNYGITLNHSYAFVLLHLKSKNDTKNILQINIPQVAIFYNQVVYDVLYNSEGHIKGLKDKQQVRLHKVYTFFLQKSKERNYSKQIEQSIACFEGDQYLLLTDTDLFITCRKFINDPFFKKLYYIRNKLKVTQTNIQVYFNAVSDCRFRGEAMKVFLGHKKDEAFLKQLGEFQYLKFSCQKIALFLNYEQNIRIIKATFIFSRGIDQKYYLMDVKGLEFSNLSDALGRRQLRLKQKQASRMQKLIITEDQYESLKEKEQKDEVKQMEKEMNSQFMKIAMTLNVQTNRGRFEQYNRTQLAFKKLFPSISGKILDKINQLNVKSMHKVILKTQGNTDSSLKKKSYTRNYYSLRKPKFSNKTK